MVSEKAIRECNAKFGPDNDYGNDERHLPDCLKVFEILEERFVWPPPPGEEGEWEKDVSKSTVPAETTTALVDRMINASGLRWDENPITEISGGEEFLQNYLRLPRTSRPNLSKEELESVGIYDTVIDLEKFAHPEDRFVPKRVMEILGRSRGHWYDPEGHLHSTESLIEEMLGETTKAYNECQLTDDKLDCGSHYSEKATPPGFNRNYIMIRKVVEEPGEEKKLPPTVVGYLGEEKFRNYLIEAKAELENMGYDVLDSHLERTAAIGNLYTHMLWGEPEGFIDYDLVRRMLSGVIKGRSTEAIVDDQNLIRPEKSTQTRTEDKRIKIARFTEPMEKFVKKAEDSIKEELQGRTLKKALSTLSSVAFDQAVARFQSEYITRLTEDDIERARRISESHWATKDTNTLNPYAPETPEYAVLRLVWLGVSDNTIRQQLALEPRAIGQEAPPEEVQKFPLLKAKRVYKDQAGKFVSEWEEGGVTKESIFVPINPYQKSYLNHVVEVRDALKEIEREMKSLAPLGPKPVRLTFSNEPWDQLTKSGKCFGRTWDSCEMPTGAYSQGVFDDVAHWNGVGILRWGDVDKKSWDGRVQLRWCEKPAEEDGGPRKKDIGIEERLYPQGGGRVGENLRSHPYEMAIIPYMKDVLKGKGYLDYSLCITPYKHKGGYDDMMHGWVAGQGFANVSLYDLAHVNPGISPTELFFGDEVERQEAFLERYQQQTRREPEPEVEDEEEEPEEEFDWDSWYWEFRHEYDYDGVARNTSTSEYNELYYRGNMETLIRGIDWSGFNDDGDVYPSFESAWRWAGYEILDNVDDDDYLDWVNYPERLETFGTKMEGAEIPLFAVIRPATSADETPITDVYYTEHFVDANSGDSPGLGLKDMQYPSMTGPFVDFEECMEGTSARERRSLERWPERSRPQVLKCATNLFTELNVALHSRTLGWIQEHESIPTDVKVVPFDEDFVRKNEAIIDKYEPDGVEEVVPGPLFSVCAYLQGKYPVSSQYSAFESKRMANLVNLRGLPTKLRQLLDVKCKDVTPEVISSIEVKASGGGTIHAYSPYRRQRITLDEG